jgi:putative chitinase
VPHIIDLIDAQLLKKAAPETPITELAMWAQPLKDACRWGEIDTVREVACFLGQGAHESQGFTRLTENLNYSAQRMAEVWPRRFAVNRHARPLRPNGLALSLDRKPELIANIVYANRMGNGAPATGDGWRYRGAGIWQLTGANNHKACAAALGLPLEGFGDYLRSRQGAAMSAAWFFRENDLDALAATPGVEDETRRINGGVHGLQDRKARFDAVVAELLRRGA